MTFDDWIDGVATALGIDDDIDVDRLLDVARVAAHAAERRAAPVTTYLIGIALARGMTLDDAIGRVDAVARSS